MMRPSRVVACILILAGLTGVSLSQTRIDRSVFSTGGTRAGNGAIALVGSIGQTIAGPAKTSMQQGSFGFWAGKRKTATAVERLESLVPSVVALEPVFPNPAGGLASLRFALPSAQFVQLFVTDALGRTVLAMVDELLPEGSYRTEFRVDRLPAGTYFCRLQAGERRLTGKFLVIK